MAHDSTYRKRGKDKRLYQTSFILNKRISPRQLNGRYNKPGYKESPF